MPVRPAAATLSTGGRINLQSPRGLWQGTATTVPWLPGGCPMHQGVEEVSCSLLVSGGDSPAGAEQRAAIPSLLSAPTGFCLHCVLVALGSFLHHISSLPPALAAPWSAPA